MEKAITSALISVYHKTGLEPVIAALQALGVTLYSTGGTFDFIRQQGAQATPVEDLTGYPSIFGGRVKTLHPAVFGGILHRRAVQSDLAEAEKHHIPAIDLVIVDLYPFEHTRASGAAEEEIVEKIDIGGVSLLRAAAKNHADVVVISHQGQYQMLVDLLTAGQGRTTLAKRRQLAADAIGQTARYDLAIHMWLAGKQASATLPAEALYGPATPLRYGENPHQPASFLGSLESLFTQQNGKELSYNNLLDLDAALALLADFEPEQMQGLTTCAIIKHNNACGLAVAATPLQAWQEALSTDPVSAFGGVIVFNQPVTAEAAQAVDGIFFEIIAAPAFDAEALAILKSKKNRIILETKPYRSQPFGMRAMLNGLAMQQNDTLAEQAHELKTVTDVAPTEAQTKALLLAARVCKHTRSNAIVFATGSRMLSSGMGQTSRVDALRQAIAKAAAFNLPLAGAVMASDAFFPFPDCVEIAAEAGISAIIQPGGSIKDQDSVNAANRLGLAMVMSGRRHFKH